MKTVSDKAQPAEPKSIDGTNMKPMTAHGYRRIRILEPFPIPHHCEIQKVNLSARIEPCHRNMRKLRCQY